MTQIHTPKGLDAYRYIIFNDGEKARVTSNIPGQKVTLQGIFKKNRLTYLARAVYFWFSNQRFRIERHFPKTRLFLSKTETDLGRGHICRICPLEKHSGYDWC